jgi:hypothetical protein
MITKERRKPGKARSSSVNDTHSAEGYSRVSRREGVFMSSAVFSFHGRGKDVIHLPGY